MQQSLPFSDRYYLSTLFTTPKARSKWRRLLHCQCPALATHCFETQGDVSTHNPSINYCRRVHGIRSQHLFQHVVEPSDAASAVTIDAMAMRFLTFLLVCIFLNVYIFILVCNWCENLHIYIVAQRQDRKEKETYLHCKYANQLAQHLILILG